MRKKAQYYEKYLVDDYKNWCAYWFKEKYGQVATVEYWFPCQLSMPDSRRYAIYECKRWTEQMIKKLKEPRLVSCRQLGGDKLILDFHKGE